MDKEYKLIDIYASMRYLNGALFIIAVVLLGCAAAYLGYLGTTIEDPKITELYFNDDPPPVVEGEAHFSFILHNRATTSRNYTYTISLDETDIFTNSLFVDPGGRRMVRVGLQGGNVSGKLPIRVRVDGQSIHHWSLFQ